MTAAFNAFSLYISMGSSFGGPHTRICIHGLRSRHAWASFSSFRFEHASKQGISQQRRLYPERWFGFCGLEVTYARLFLAA
jgi:hypothetical protein